MADVLIILAHAVRIYSYIVLAAVILSWLRLDPTNPIVSMIREITEPPMEFIRRALPFLMVGGLDLSPLVLLFGCHLLSRVLMTMAYNLG